MLAAISGFDPPISVHWPQTPNFFHGNFLTLWGSYRNIDSFSSHLTIPRRNFRLTFQEVFVFFYQLPGSVLSKVYVLPSLWGDGAAASTHSHPSAQWIHTQGDRYTRSRHPSSWDQAVKSDDTQGGCGECHSFFPPLEQCCLICQNRHLGWLKQPALFAYPMDHLITGMSNACKTATWRSWAFASGNMCEGMREMVHMLFLLQEKPTRIIVIHISLALPVRHSI